MTAVVIALAAMTAPASAAQAPQFEHDSETTSPLSSTSEQLTVTLNPEGAVTTYRVDYDVEDSAWCESFGQQGAPASSATQMLNATDATDHTVDAELDGLAPHTYYCFAFVADNGAGTAQDFPGSLFQAAPVPTAVTLGAGESGATTMLVGGWVFAPDQADASDTDYHVEYAPAGSIWCTSQGTQGSPSGSTASQPSTGNSDVSVTVSGLVPDEQYCLELVGTDQYGSAGGGFVTATEGSRPALTTGDASTLSPTSESISGTVDPEGLGTTYSVVYDLASSGWCDPYVGGTPSYATSDQSLPASDLSDHQVSVSLTGLVAGQQYCADLQATNSIGTGLGTRQVFFTAGDTSASGSGQTSGFGGQGSGPGAGPEPATFARAARASVKVLRGPALLVNTGYRGACPESGVCSFVINATMLAKVHSVTRSVRTLRAVEVVQPGRSGALTVTIRGAAARTLIKAGRFSVRFTVRANNAVLHAPPAPARRVTLVLPKHKHRRSHH